MTLWRRKWQPTPVFLPGKSHGQRSLGGYSPWGRKESDTTERLHFTSALLTMPKPLTVWMTINCGNQCQVLLNSTSSVYTICATTSNQALIFKFLKVQLKELLLSHSHTKVCSFHTEGYNFLPATLALLIQESQVSVPLIPSYFLIYQMHMRYLTLQKHLLQQTRLDFKLL